MASERKKLRGVVLAEDKRTERFFRNLLKKLGFGRFRFDTAPKGQGAGEAWVLRRYPAEVKLLRSKNFQAALRLVAARDSDNVGVSDRKQELDQALTNAGLEARQAGEHIATPVPTRNIETWLLALLGANDLDETTDYKHRFENEYGASERNALSDAAAAWQEVNDTSLPSLRDGAAEMARIDP